MSNITTTEVKGLFNEWGIKVYDYSYVYGSSTYSNLDYEALQVKVNLKRASSQEQEITGLSTKMKKRNTEISELGSLLADLGTLAKQYKNEGGTESKDVTWSTAGLEGLKIIADSWYYSSDSNGKYLHIEISGSYTGNFYYQDSKGNSKADSVQNTTYELLNQRAKSMTDSLNNETQNDMTRLQSIVNKRDDSYSTTTTLSKSISDARATAIKNM